MMIDVSGYMFTFIPSGANAQCPPLYEFIGGRCLSFFTDLTESFADSTITCQYFDGKLAKIDDCQLLSDIAVYLRDNGKNIQ